MQYVAPRRIALPMRTNGKTFVIKYFRSSIFRRQSCGGCCQVNWYVMICPDVWQWQVNFSGERRDLRTHETCITESTKNLWVYKIIWCIYRNKSSALLLRAWLSYDSGSNPKVQRWHFKMAFPNGFYRVFPTRSWLQPMEKAGAWFDKVILPPQMYQVSKMCIFLRSEQPN